MPVQLFTQAARARRNRFPETIAHEDLVAFFTLSERDLDSIPRSSAAHNRLGYALQLAQRAQDAALLLTAHLALGASWFHLGNPALACAHLEHTIALYDPAQHHVLAYRYGGIDLGIAGYSNYAWALWLPGYPTQTRAQSAKALSLAQQLAHPYTLTRTLYFDTLLC
jgi:hypothetical protein